MTEPLLDEWIAAPEGCPRFGLRGDDPEAPATILYWVGLRRAKLLAIEPDSLSPPQRDKLEHELTQCTEAEQIAWKMRDYQNGIVEEESAPDTMREEQKTAKYHSDRVNNAVAEVSEAIRYLNQFGPAPPHYAHSLKHLKNLADKLLPKAYRK